VHQVKPNKRLILSWQDTIKSVKVLLLHFYYYYNNPGKRHIII